jgi:hypothetical protein
VARPAFGIRHQLWALFGLFLLTGGLVLAIDEIAQQRSRVSLERMKDQSLQRMQLLNAVFEDYSGGVVDTTFKARNSLITWHEGVARVDAARRDIDTRWARLEALPRTSEQRTLLDQTRAARVRADAAAATLRGLLQREDIGALGRFADTELYPAVDPVTDRLQQLSNAAMHQAEAVVQADIARGRAASALRIGLSIDDFGTGYSSLAQLSQVPFTELKIDQGFVTGAHAQPRKRAVVEASLDLARKLDLETVGEGVETTEDWQMLATLGCSAAQGFLISPAVPGEELVATIGRWRRPN